ncbi:MAG: hypothetical protein KF723_15685 [Rhizobiaceae bacterium]|nr:hypothetical protein [Rhizobiaceae bacterium]
MVWNLDTSWLMLAVALVSVIAFMFGSALHALIGEDGFGPFGNMLIIDAGFFGAIVAANMRGLALTDLTLAVGVGMAGSFAALAGLALLKAGLQRI